MRVLLVAPQSSDTILGVIGSYCSEALVNLGYDIKVFDFRRSQHLVSPAGSLLKKVVRKVPIRRPLFIHSLEKEKMNHRLSEKVKEYQPDIILVLLGDTIFPKTLEEIRKQGVIIVNWFPDTVLAPIRKDFVQNISSYYTIFLLLILWMS